MKRLGLLGLAATLGAIVAPATITAATQEYRGQDDAGDALPPNFRGRITYQGSFSAEASRAGRVASNASPIVRRIAAKNDRSWTEDGTITITVEYSGNRVTGSSVGSGGMGRGTFSGTRNGNSCTITSGQGDSNTMRCGRAMWSGTSRSAPTARVVSSVRIEARATRVADFAKEERERAEAARRAALRPSPAPESGTRSAAIRSTPARPAPSSGGTPFAPGEDAISRAIKIEAARTAHLVRPDGFTAMANRDGSAHPCLETRQSSQEAETQTIRDGDGNFRDSATMITGSTTLVRNRCGSAQTHMFGGSNMSFPARSTVTVHCSHGVGENAFGRPVPSGISYCSRAR